MLYLRKSVLFLAGFKNSCVNYKVNSVHDVGLLDALRRFVFLLDALRRFVFSCQNMYVAYILLKWDLYAHITNLFRKMSILDWPAVKNLNL